MLITRQFVRVVIGLVGTGFACVAGCVAAPTPEEEELADAQLELATVTSNTSALYWGTVSYVTCNSVWSCQSQSNNPGAVLCANKGANTYWEPLMYCDATCATAVSKSYSDADRIITMPTTSSGVSCNQKITVCWGGRCSDGVVRDKSAASKWELSKAVMDDLAAPLGTLNSGVSFYSGAPNATAPTPLTPTSWVTKTSPVTLSWASSYAGAGATYYDVALSYYSNGAWQSAGLFSSAKNKTLITFNMSPYPWAWTVRACNANGCGSWSAWAYFYASVIV